MEISAAFYRNYTNNINYYIIKQSKNTGRFIMFFVITNNYNKKTEGPNSMELFTATGKL